VYWKYNNYRLPDEMSFVYTCRAKLDAGGVPYAYMPEYRLRGQMVIDDQGTAAANQTAMTVAMTALRNAFSVNFGDLILYDDNDQPTVHRMLTRETLGGVKVMSRPEAPTSYGGEYGAFHTFEVVLASEVAANASNPNAVINWTESVDYVGTGGPRKVWTEFIDGDPQLDQVAQRTTIKAVQRGAARTLGAYPRPVPIYPIDVEHEDQRIWSPGSPEYLGNGAYAYYPATWAYFFEFANPQFGNPTGRPQ